MSNMFPGMDMDCLPTKDDFIFGDLLDWAVSLNENSAGEKIFTFKKDTPQKELDKFLTLSKEYKKQLKLSDTYYIEE